MHLKKLLPFLLLILCISTKTIAQDTTDIMSQLEKEATKDNIEYTAATFKTTRVVNGHSVENTAAGVLDVRINHRFNEIKNGLYDLFGLDKATMRLGFDYGITNNIMIGVGHSTNQKTYDMFLKIKLLRQSTGRKKMPFTLSYVPTIAVNTQNRADLGFSSDTAKNLDLRNRTSFAHQLIIGRKFSEGFSLQLMPTHIYHDDVSFPTTQKHSFALGVAARQKISRRISINAEYYYMLPGTKPSLANNVLSFGFDIETGGHVFQLHFTNSHGMTEKSFIGETIGRWDRSNILFGFNISRVFTVKKPK